MQVRLVKSAVKSRLPFISVFLAAMQFWPQAVHSQEQAQNITCENGSGQYSTEFSTGTTVSVGPLRNRGFAKRACTAKLIWNGQEISVASDAAKVGIDVLGADLGFGMPVVAFQIDETGEGTHRSYQIYSLMKPPRLLYAITGADSYTAADTDLDGKVEIWTNDAAAIDGFEKVPLQSFDFAPTVVLRFEKKRIVDVSSEFLSHYDTQIADLRTQIDQQELAAFKNSDGVLSMQIPRSSDDLHRLIRTKIKVLEIVWAYLYSGRDAEAWSALQNMWPSQDFKRIRMTISDIRQRGILRGIAPAPRRPMHKQQVHIYDATVRPPAVSSQGTLSPSGVTPYPTDTEQEPPVVLPKSILLLRPSPADGEQLSATDTEAVMELLVDAAGKVRSAKVLNGADSRWVQASGGWHFIPALRDGIPVACRFRFSIWDRK
jgi:hypothetical protein